jgi:biotin carboxylase
MSQWSQTRRILLLATTTGYQTRAFADAARRLGVEAVLATNRCHQLDDPWGDHAIAVRFEEPYRSAEILAAAGREHPFSAVVAVGDQPTFLAALAAERLGLPYNSPATVEACRNKYLARERFRAAGLRVPEYFRIALDASPEEAARRAQYPCVLKPLGLSASRGVIRADDEREFEAAFARIRKLLESREVESQREESSRWVQVERFIPGREFALEGLVTEGRIQVLALFDKPDPLDGPFFEETIYVTPSREHPAAQAELAAAVQRGIEALGVSQGPVHAEARLNTEGVWLLEIAARSIGGLCARALRFGDGSPLEELVLRHALGEDVSSARLADRATGVMMIPIPRAGIYESVSGVERAGAVPGVNEVLITAKPGQRLLPLPEGASYLGFIFARGQSPAEVESALRAAHRKLRFEIAETLPVMATPSSAAGRSPAGERRPPRRNTPPSA